MPAVTTPEDLDRWRQAGQVGARALHLGASLCKEGETLLSVVEGVEQFVQDQGLAMAFPCTVSLNQVAAHFTPDHLNTDVFQAGDLVKVDCGACLDGALSDNAITVEVTTNEHQDLIRTSEACLEKALEHLGPLCNLGDVGAAVEAEAKERGFKAIGNLTGHSLEAWNLHAGLTVPSVGMRIHRKPKVGDVLAVEPFITNGEAGRVVNGGPGNIYHYQGRIPTRLPSQRNVLAAVAKAHPKLPFSQRWITHAAEPRKLNFHVDALVKSGGLKHYPALVEASGGMVSQREHTVLVTEAGVEVLTRA